MAYRYISGSVGDIFKIIGASICCLLTLGATGVFFYLMANVPEYELSYDTNITKFEVLNKIIDYGCRCSEKQGLIMILGGILLLIAILFSIPIDYICEIAPLGKFGDFDIGANFITRSLNQVLPAVILGGYIAIHYICMALLPSKIDICINLLMPIAIFLAAAILLAHIIAVIINGGIWGTIIRLPLLFAENFGLTILFAFLGTLILLIMFFILFGSFMLGTTSRAILIGSLKD